MFPEKGEKGLIENKLIKPSHRLDLYWHLGPITVGADHDPKCWVFFPGTLS